MPSDIVIWAVRGLINRFLNVIARNVPGARSLRVYIHKLRGVKIKGRVFISPGVYFDDEHPELIEIGNDVSIGTNTILISHFRDGPTGIKIHDHAFIGPGVIILNNVEIGEGAVVAAGSVVNKNVPAYTFVSGVPSRPLYRVTYPLGDEWPDGRGSVYKFGSGLKPL